MPSASRLRPPVKCCRYCAKRSAENWSTEMATTRWGGGRSCAKAGAAANGRASRQARRASFIPFPLRIGAKPLHQPRRRTSASTRSTSTKIFGSHAPRNREGKERQMEPADAADIIAELNEEKAEAEADTRFRNRAALQIAIIAAVLAIGGLGGGNATDDMVANNIKASDSWSFYQAKNVRQTMYELAADQLKADLAANAVAPAAGPGAEARLGKYE